MCLLAACGVEGWWVGDGCGAGVVRGAVWAFWCEGRCRGGEGVVGVVLAGVCGYGRAVEVDLVRGEGGVGWGLAGGGERR